MHNLQLSDYIKVFDDVANKTLINSLLKIIYEKNNFEKAGTVGLNGNRHHDESIRNVNGFFFEESSIKTVAERVLYNKLQELTSDLIQKYVNEVPYSDKEVRRVTFQFLNYTSEDKGHYTWHTDAGTYCPRIHTMLIGLNSEYQGGHLNIINDKIKVKLNTNQAVIFPSNFCFPHKVNPVISGNRKVLVIWTE